VLRLLMCYHLAAGILFNINEPFALPRSETLGRSAQSTLSMCTHRLSVSVDCRYCAE